MQKIKDIHSSFMLRFSFNILVNIFVILLGWFGGKNGSEIFALSSFLFYLVMETKPAKIVFPAESDRNRMIVRASTDEVKQIILPTPKM